MVVLKIEAYFITSIVSSQKRGVLLMYVDTIKTEVIVFIGIKGHIVTSH